MKSFLKYWLPLLIWLGVIFINSSSAMSAEHTSRHIVPVLLWLKPGMSPQAIWMILVFARKSAHVIEYTVLALLLWQALRSFSIFRTKILVAFGAALLGSAIFAARDDFHQTLIQWLTASVPAVFLSVAGAPLGVLIVSIFPPPPPKQF